MKSVKFDPNKAKQEQSDKKEKLAKEEERNSYIEELKEDPRFQEYIVEDILKRKISELTDTRIIRKVYEKNGGNISNKEELADIVLQSIQASIKLEQILSELLN